MFFSSEGNYGMSLPSLLTTQLTYLQLVNNLLSNGNKSSGYPRYLEQGCAVYLETAWFSYFVKMY